MTLSTVVVHFGVLTVLWFVYACGANPANGDHSSSKSVQRTKPPLRAVPNVPEAPTVRATAAVAVPSTSLPSPGCAPGADPVQNAIAQAAPHRTWRIEFDRDVRLPPGVRPGSIVINAGPVADKFSVTYQSILPNEILRVRRALATLSATDRACRSGTFIEISGTDKNEAKNLARHALKCLGSSAKINNACATFDRHGRATRLRHETPSQQYPDLTCIRRRLVHKKFPLFAGTTICFAAFSYTF